MLRRTAFAGMAVLLASGLLAQAPAEPTTEGASCCRRTTQAPACCASESVKMRCSHTERVVDKCCCVKQEGKLHCTLADQDVESCCCSMVMEDEQQ